MNLLEYEEKIVEESIENSFLSHKFDLLATKIAVAVQFVDLNQFYELH